MKKSYVLQQLAELAPLERAQFYVSLSPSKRADMDVIVLVYPYVLEDSLVSMTFTYTIYKVYARNPDKVIEFLKSGKTDSWIVNYIDPEFLCIENLYFIAKAAIEADYHFHGHLTPTSTDIINQFKLNERLDMVVKLASLFPELISYQSDETRAHIAAKMF